MINRRPQPLMVSGAWDFAGVLLATSGFLLFVGPALLSGIFRQSLHDLPLHHEIPTLESALTEIWSAWWVIWVLYYLLVIGGALVLMWMRRDTTVVYNVESQTLESALGRAAQRLGLEMQRRGNRVILGNAQQSIVDLQPFPMLSNVSLHWRGAEPVARADLERELRKALAEVVTLDNVAGSWLLGIAAFLFLLIMVMTGIFVALVLMLARMY
jgi:hypothetical protein